MINESSLRIESSTLTFLILGWFHWPQICDRLANSACIRVLAVQADRDSRLLLYIDVENYPPTWLREQSRVRAMERFAEQARLKIRARLGAAQLGGKLKVATGSVYIVKRGFSRRPALITLLGPRRPVERRRPSAAVLSHTVRDLGILMITLTDVPLLATDRGHDAWR